MNLITTNVQLVKKCEGSHYMIPQLWHASSKDKRRYVMAKRSEILFQPGVSLFDFQLQYRTDEQCRDHLFHSKWLKRVSVPQCEFRRYYLIRSRSLYQCCRCHRQTSFLRGGYFLFNKTSLKSLVSCNLSGKSVKGRNFLIETPTFSRYFAKCCYASQT